MPHRLQASLWIVYVIIPVLILSQQVSQSEDAGRWGPWTAWSVCSQTCGSGLAYRVRHCHRSPGDGGQCSGQHKQHQVCNRQVCPGGQADYRSMECQKRNRNYYGGRRYEWEAYINPYDRCELACKARHHRYYARFREIVQDGTPCKHDTDAICLAGKCLDVGCDAILGSGAVVDQCGMCGGNGSTCRVISGIFTRTRLRQYGYHHVTTLPAGACNINITELARSRNYLALTTADGVNIVNGDKKLRPVGRYSGAGTSFDYRRRSGLWCPGACIFADGPLTQSVHVQLLYYDRNPGIMYHFTVPQDTAKAVMHAANTTPTHTHHQHPHDLYPHHSPPQQNTPSHHRSSIRGGGRGGEGEDSGADASNPRLGKRRWNRTRTPSGKGSRGASGEESGEESSSTPYDDRNGDNSSSSLEDSPASLVLGPREQQGLENRPQELQHLSTPGEELSPEGPLSPLPSAPRQPSLGQSTPGSESQAEAPLFPPSPSVLPNVASAPRYVPPEEGSAMDGAPIEYRHYYHVDSDDYRQLSQRGDRGGRVAALNAAGDSWNNRGWAGGRGAGAEALSRPNLIPARRWGSEGLSSSSSRLGGGDVNNDVNAVGDVPLAVPASGYFQWTISGFTECSLPCGGGTQQTLVVCMKSDTRVVVMGENCDINARPSPTTVVCNTQPCQPQWTSEEWSACSVTCGHGVQSRRVECGQRISPTLRLSVSADRCTAPKPPVTQFCRQPLCFQWKVSNWTDCSTDCGLGERTRRAWCVNGEGVEVETSRCMRQDRPRVKVICDMGSCAKGWYYTRWSRECTPECGAKTYKTRQVHCAAEDGGLLPGDRCPADQKPRTRKSCGTSQPCGGKWFSGPWSPCNVSCGEAWRSREVVCMKKHGRRLWGVVGKENCLRKERPLHQEPCTSLPPCQPLWYFTHWSQCSQSCGTGIKMREVKCLDDSFKASLTCPTKRRPQDRRPCNIHACNSDSHNDSDSNVPHSHQRHANDYGPQPPRKVLGPQRYQESTSPNTTFQQQHQRANHSRQAPMALQVSAPARVNLLQDVRSALGDDDKAHHRRRHHHHHITSSSDGPELTTEANDDNSELTSDGAPTTSTTTPITKQQTPAATPQPADPGCKDKPNGRWCLFVSQARLCGYRHYQRQCCLTCTKYNLHH